MHTTITLATWFTIARLVLVPFVIVSMLSHQWAYAFWLFTAAATTDVLDGFLARVRNERTFLGACLDPIADKVLVITIFCTLIVIKAIALSQWFLFFMLAKEMMLIAGAALLYYKNGSVAIEPSFLGKATMFAQVVFIGLLFAAYAASAVSLTMFAGGMVFIALMALGSLVLYIKQGVRQW